MTAIAAAGEFPAHLPLLFETNRGQASDATVKFITRSRGAAVGLGAREAVLALRRADGSGATVRMVLAGAGASAAVRGVDRQPTHVHYYAGQDSSKWLTDIPAWGSVETSGVYPGIDLVWYGKDGELEHDFRVAPGADPSSIRLRFEGIDGLRIDGSGDLVLAGCDVRFRRPVLYQKVGEERRAVAGSFQMRSAHEAGFDIGAYDHSRPLVIDPVITYGAYLGGVGDDKVFSLDSDGWGNTVLAGVTTSLDFPGRNNPNSNQPLAVFVAKVNASGLKFDYVAVFGGIGNYGPDPDFLLAQADGARSAVTLTFEVANGTEIPPSQPGEPPINLFGPQPLSHDPGLIVLFRLDDKGKLQSSAVINGGGLDRPTGIATDVFGNTIVTGESNSPDLPCSKRYGTPLTANDPRQIFALKLDPNDNLSYLTCLNGSLEEENAHVAADWQGNAYLTFGSHSLDLPRTLLVGPDPAKGGIVQPCLIVAVKLSSDGVLKYATWINGSDENGPVGIAADLLGNAYIAAETMSIDFPLTRLIGTPLLQQGGAVPPCLTVAIKLDSSGKPVYITGVNGSGDDEPTDIIVDALGRPYIVGVTDSADFPFTDKLGQPSQSINRMFVLRLNVLGGLRDAVGIAGGSMGATPTGIGLDLFGRVYIGGYTKSPDFPVTPGSLGTKPFGGTDAFLLRLSNFGLQ
jgi:hypothetical protein